MFSSKLDTKEKQHMIYYINVNKKRIVGRNNQISTRPLNLEYDVTEVIDFQFIDDNNQLQPLSPNTPGLTLAIGLKQNMPSYDLLALSHDYEIVNGQTLRFTVNTYTVNWLKKINKPNTEVFIEISQQSLENKKVWMRDYCYVWPRVYTAGLEPAEIESNDYYTKTETDEAIENAIEGIGISGYVTTQEFEDGLSTKQNVIDDENKLAYELLSGTPSIPTKTSDLENDSDFITTDALSGYATETALSTHTSDTTIHVTAENKETWDGKQDEITESEWLPATYVHMDINHYPSDPDFTVEAAVNMTRDDVYEISGVVSGLITDKLNVSSYVAPYKLPYNAAGNGWLEEDIGVTLEWSDQDIIPNDRKIVVVAYSDNGDDHLVFPTLFATTSENVIKTCEVWVKMAGNTTEAQGIAAIVVPSSYYIVDESNFPTKLKGEATNSEAYTYHIFVIRTVPRQGASLCEVGYSHFINTNLSI